MKRLRFIGLGLCGIVFWAAAAVVGLVVIGMALHNRFMFAVVAAGAVAAWFWFRKGGGRPLGGRASVPHYNLLALYPEAKDGGGGSRKMENLSVRLSRAGFLQAGLYRAYEQSHGHVRKKELVIEGFADPVRGVYAALSRSGREVWLELLAPYADGRVHVATDADWEASPFAQRLPGVVLHPGAGTLPEEVLETLLARRPDAPMADVSPDGFRGFYMGYENALHEWVLSGMNAMRDTDFALREAYARAGGSAGGGDPEGLVFIHDGLALWQVKYLVMLAGAWPIFSGPEKDGKYASATAREAGRMLAGGRGRLRKQIRLIDTIDSPVPADVYQSDSA